jgi:tetratricopeptide (TPR) repeat protein
MTGVRHFFAGEEEMRRRLARKLHDNHGQRLSALGFDLRAVRNQLAEGDPRRDALDLATRKLGELGDDLRHLSHELHPAILERRGLEVALRDRCTELEERHGLPVELDFQAEHPIPAEVALALYRIAQEGLTNAVRHAGARTARLALCADRGTVRLTLADDGAGFDPLAARREGGLGLVSMEERARLLGGRCRIVSAPGSGTTVEVTVPRRRLGRWLRRHLGWVAAVVMVTLTFGGGLLTTLLEARRAEAEAHRAEAVVQFLEELLTASDPHRSRGELPDSHELLRRGSDRLKDGLADEPLLRARLLDTLGGLYTELALYEEARPLLEEALALRQKLLGDAHPEVAATLVRLGSLAHLSGQGDPVALFERALEIRTARANREPEELADLLNKLGVALAAKTRLDEAEPVLRRSLALHERLFGKDDPRVAKVLHNLSGIAFYREHLEATEALIGRALEIREAALPEDDLELAGSREVLAMLRRRQGRPAEAADLLEGLAAAAERVYGPEHPELARKLLNLGAARAELGEEERARALFERALAISEASLAPEQPLHLRALATLAEHHLRQGRLDEAEPLYRRLLALHEQGVPFQSWDRVLAQWQELLAGRAREALP